MEFKTLEGDAAVITRPTRQYNWMSLGKLVEKANTNKTTVGFVFEEMQEGQYKGFITSFRERFGNSVKLRAAKLNSGSETGYRFQIVLK